MLTSIRPILALWIGQQWCRHHHLCEVKCYYWANLGPSSRYMCDLLATILSSEESSGQPWDCMERCNSSVWSSSLCIVQDTPMQERESPGSSMGTDPVDSANYIVCSKDQVQCGSASHWIVWQEQQGHKEVMVELEDHVPSSPPHLSVGGKFAGVPTITLISVHY